MLVRTQILLEEKQKLELEELAEMAGISVSKLVRKALPCGVKEEKRQVMKIKTKKNGGMELLNWLAKHPVHAGGESNHDKYAYDWEYDKELRDKTK